MRERKGERMIRRDETGWSPLLHLKLFHPQEDVLGLPALAPARRALHLHNASADWAKSLIDNSAKPSGALASVAGGEIGADLVWRPAGLEETETLPFADEAGRLWPVSHLRALNGTLSWVRRGLNVPESWALPEAENTGRFDVAFDTGGGFGEPVRGEMPSAAVIEGAIAVRLAEIGADGRRGRWLSIPLVTP